jgi:hypothetical protein
MNGYQRRLLKNSAFHAIVRVGQAINMDWNGYKVASIPLSTSIPSILVSHSNPFNKSVLTSSPPDIDAIQATNLALNQQIESGEPLTTPAKNYVPYLVQILEDN